MSCSDTHVFSQVLYVSPPTPPTLVTNVKGIYGRRARQLHSLELGAVGGQRYSIIGWFVGTATHHTTCTVTGLLCCDRCGCV